MAGNEGELASRPTSARVYRTDAIAVHWNPERCIHAARCAQGLPAVFQPGQRPWVKVDATTADEIADVITRCPSGALHFERLDGGAQEAAGDGVTIAAQPHGPLHARGPLRIIGADGALLREDTRAALCGCGQSEHKPFCDNICRTAGSEK